MSQFLSMKLEAVNSRMPSGIEVFPPKDVSIMCNLCIDLFNLNNPKAGFVPIILNFSFGGLSFNCFCYTG